MAASLHFKNTFMGCFGILDLAKPPLPSILCLYQVWLVLVGGTQIHLDPSKLMLSLDRNNSYHWCKPGSGLSPFVYQVIILVHTHTPLLLQYSNVAVEETEPQKRYKTTQDLTAHRGQRWGLNAGPYVFSNTQSCLPISIFGLRNSRTNRCITACGLLLHFSHQYTQTQAHVHTHVCTCKYHSSFVSLGVTWITSELKIKNYHQFSITNASWNTFHL